LIVSGKSAAGGIIQPAPSIVDVAPMVLQLLGVMIAPKWRLEGKAVGRKVAAPENIEKQKRPLGE